MKQITQALTRVNPATNTEGTTVTALMRTGASVTIPFDYESEDMHEKAVTTLMNSQGLVVSRIKRTGDAPRGGMYSVVLDVPAPSLLA